MNPESCRALPLCVDMDDTLLHTDVLRVGIGTLLAHKIWLLPWFIVWLIIHRAAAKAWLAKEFPPNVSALPYRAELLAYLRAQKASGRAIYLVSAADQRIVNDVAQHVGLFIAAYGSDGTANLKGSAKAAFIQARIGKNFVYAGDSFADLQVWHVASGAILCGKAIMFSKKLPIPIEATFP